MVCASVSGVLINAHTWENKYLFFSSFFLQCLYVYELTLNLGDLRVKSSEWIFRNLELPKD